MVDSKPFSSSYVLILPRWYPNRKDPADGNFIQAHIEAISKSKAVKVLFIKGLEDLKKEIEVETSESAQISEIKVYYKLKKGLLAPIFNTLKYFSLQLRYYNQIALENGKPDMVHVHVLLRSAFLALYLKTSQNIPFLVSEHWSGYYELENKIGATRKICIRYVLNKASAISAVSKSLLNTLSSFTSNKNLNIVPNVVSDEFSLPQSLPDNTVKRVLHVSNMIPNVKQTDKLILMLDEIAAHRNDFTCVFVGDGKKRQEMQNLAQRAKNLNGRIEFTGDIDKSKLASLMKKSDIILSYSSIETQSIVLLEALSSGMVVVAPAVGGIPEYLEGKGYLFEVNNENAFKESVHFALDAEKKYNYRANSSFVKENYSAQVVAEKFQSIYSRIL